MKDNGIKFDFDKNKDAEEKNLESTETKESTDATEAEAPTNDAELTDNALDGEENDTETDAQTDGDKAVVTYIGNGVWRDSEGKGWARTENRGAGILATRSYSKAEYDKREDLNFMVRYGEMKLTLV